jgi:zinc transporter, ZIP family
MIAIGIGLHNLGEGLAIGSAYAVGALAVGAALVVGFALHNLTEGLAIVAPLTNQRPPIRSLIGLGAVALSAVLLGVGVGAITQVITQISPALRDHTGRLLDPTVIGGLATGVAVMYLTSLLVTA